MSDAPWQERLFRAMLRLFPAEFRGDFGDQMSADFQDHRHDARGRVASFRLWLHTAFGLLRQAPREHLDILARDAGYAIRVLRRRPGYALTALLTVAVGIALNAAVFTVVHGVLLQPIALPESERLVRLYEVTPPPDRRTVQVSPANFVDWQAQVTTLDAMATIRPSGFSVVTGHDPEEIVAARISEAFFTMLRPGLALGRLFTPAEYDAMAPRPEGGGPAQRQEPTVAILSYKLWQRQFNGRPDVLGMLMPLGGFLAGRSVEIVGVLAPGFELPGWSNVDCWMPDAMEPDMRRARYIAAYGRLAPGTDLETAQAELETIASRLSAAYPDANAGYRVKVIPLIESLTTHVSTRLWFLLAAAGCVLLIVCANLANLILAHVSGRRRELVIRSAIGATRMHLIRQSLTEGLVIAWAGGALGLLLAVWALPSLLAIAPPDVPRLAEIRLGGAVVLFTAAAATLVGIACGLAPAFFVDHVHPGRASTIGVRGGATAGRRVRQGLIVAEVALALMLVIAAGLLVQTLRAIGGLELGFEPRNVLAVGIGAQDMRKYRSMAAKAQFESELVTRVRELPGVAAAGIGSRPIAGGGMGTRITLIPGADESLPIPVDAVGPGYLEALGSHLRTGRFFDDRDVRTTPLVAIVNEAAARQLWPGGEAVGQRVWMEEREYEIVGIVADVRRRSLEAPPEPTLYLASFQTGMFRANSMLVRTTGDPRELIPAIRAVVRQVDPEQALGEIRMLDEVLTEATAPRRFTFQLVGAFSLLALSLAAIGLYGVIAESVAERVPEIGVRMALGATASNVVRMIAREGLSMVLAGLAIGMAAAAALNHVMQSLVFGVETTDPAVYAVAAGCLLMVTSMGMLLPARQAAAVDPIIALRQE